MSKGEGGGGGRLSKGRGGGRAGGGGAEPLTEIREVGHKAALSIEITYPKIRHCHLRLGL